MKKQNPFLQEAVFPLVKQDWVSEYDVVWRSPSEISRDSMPYGDGETGVNVWVEKEQGLWFFIGRSDIKDQNKLVRLHLQTEPNIFSGAFFKQSLHLYDGYIEIECDAGSIKIWMDADPQLEDISVLQIEGQFNQKVQVTAELDHWRECGVLDDWKQHHEQISPKDQYLHCEKQEIGFLHINPCESAEKAFLIGMRLYGDGFSKHTGQKLVSDEPISDFILTGVIHGADTDTAEKWYQGTESQMRAYARIENHFQHHQDWWNGYWGKSHILMVNTAIAHRVNSQYILSKYLLACSCKGLFPCLYNGSIFRTETEQDAVVGFNWVSEEKTNADFRPWGGAYMGQNLRHYFWPLITSGDYELMKPLIRLIRGTVNRQRKLTWETMGHEGAYLQEMFSSADYTWQGDELPELLEETRLSRPEDSWENADWHLKYHLLPTIEFAVTFLDLYRHIRDPKFLKEVCLPLCELCVAFYDHHYPYMDENGKRVFSPASVTETYGKVRSKWHDFTQCEDVKNPVTEISGLRYLLTTLLSLKEAELPMEKRKYFADYFRQLPEVPQKRYAGAELLAPGDAYSPGLMCESAELYAVWPFRQNTFYSGTESCGIGRQSFFTRMVSVDGSTDVQPFESGGWQPSGIDAAVLGLTKEAEKLLEFNYSDTLPTVSIIADVEYKERPTKPRFEGFWNHGHMDGIPDFCHLGVSMNILQHMLLQYEGDKIYLLPAWDPSWDVSFTLYAPDRTKIECEFISGKIHSLKVTPESRRKDIINCQEIPYQIKKIISIKSTDRNHLFGLPDMEDGVVTQSDLIYRPLLKPWLTQYGEALIGTRAYYQDRESQPVFYKDNVLYLLLDENKTEFSLKKNGYRILKAVSMTGGAVSYSQNEKYAAFDLSQSEDDIVCVVKVVCDRGIAPLQAGLGIRYEPSASSQLSEAFAASNMVNSNTDQYWIKSLDDNTPVLVFTFEKEQSVSRIELLLKSDLQKHENRTRFSVEYQGKTGEYQKLFDTVAFNEIWAQKFPPVQASKIRFVFEGEKDFGVRWVRFFEK